MTDKDSKTGANDEVAREFAAWRSKTLEEAVNELTRRGVVESLLVEARPAWTLPFTLLIGKIREHGSERGFDWFICGDCPTDVAPHSVAATPREAARHFALQWQLDSAKQEQGKAASPNRPAFDTPEGLVKRAEALYELTRDPGLWPD